MCGALTLTAFISLVSLIFTGQVFWMVQGDKITGEVGDNPHDVAIGKDIGQQKSGNFGGGFTVNNGPADALQQVYYALVRIETKQDSHLYQMNQQFTQHDKRLTALEVWVAAEAQRVSRIPIVVDKQPINTFAIILIVGAIAIILLIMLLRGSGAL